VILVDTHVVVWLAFDPGQLSPKAIAAIDSARKKEGGLAISDITLLELATLVKKGCIRLAISLESFLQEGGVTIRCPAEHRSGMRDCAGTSAGLSQRPNRSRHRSYCPGSRAISTDR